MEVNPHRPLGAYLKYLLHGAGLIARARRPGKVRAIDLEAYAVMDTRVKEFFPHASVRKYQASLANNVYDALSAGYKDLVIEAPTGLGKSL